MRCAGQPSGLVLGGVTMPREPQRPTYCLIASNPTWEVWIIYIDMHYLVWIDFKEFPISVFSSLAQELHVSLLSSVR